MIEVLKQALEALKEYVNVVVSVNDPNDWRTVADGGKPAREAITSLRQAIAELESQEPVAWHEPNAYGNVTTHKNWALANGWQPLYTHPPQRTWVGLTNDELTDLFYNTNLGQASAVAQAIALLKEKNT